MNKFDILQGPPNVQDMEDRIARACAELKKFKQRMRYATIVEILAISSMYVIGFSLATEDMPLIPALMMASIGPFVAALAITLSSSLRKKELQTVIDDLQPAPHEQEVHALHGKHADVDQYLDALRLLDRRMTFAEAAMLRKKSRTVASASVSENR